MLRLRHDPALSGPDLVGLVAQLLEEARRLAAFLGFGFSLGEFVCDRGFEPCVAGKAEDLVDLVILSPRHLLLAAETGIGPKPDVDVRPAFSKAVQ